jgi:hypothetical protein
LHKDKKGTVRNAIPDEDSRIGPGMWKFLRHDENPDSGNEKTGNS